MWLTRWLCGVLAAVFVVPALARADGDPASDVLVGQSLYVPSDGGVSATQAARLSALLAEAERAGVPVRVALIATQADLGSVTELWRQPQNYARFLGQELSQVYRGTLVVVMPSGIGVAGAGHTSGAGPGQPLVNRAIGAVQAIAAAQGHRLSPPSVVAARRSGSGLGSVDLGSWLALGAGAALIAAAWTASLRARPLTRLRRAR
jgi:hypothetical protein